MINYNVLHQSISYYDRAGYTRIEAPWLVTKAISDITRPPDASSYIVRKDDEKKEKVFVGSAEQSFLYLINKGHLPASGKFQSITPCMRNDSFDSIHTKYFIKNELIIYNVNGFESTKIIPAMEQIDIMISLAKSFFGQYVPFKHLAVLQTGKEAFDITYDGIEIGSYGIRKCSFCTWIYGTGVAEPRFSTVAKEHF